jgi:diguanylate cyclase (GGDEF)-like protein
MAKKEHIKVLYIEDDEATRTLMQKVLKKPQFDYLSAANGLSGLELAIKEKPDIIIMDIDLPDIRGDELTTKIKNMEELKDTLVVGLSGMLEENLREKVLIAGAVGYLSKPISVEKFPKQIMQFIGGEKEVVAPEKKDFYHGQFELSIVERLTNKVQELELTNQDLENTSIRLRYYNESLENILTILSQLQTCKTPSEFIELMVEELSSHFQFDRCAFMDVDPESMALEIKYAKGIDKSKWDKYAYPANSPTLDGFFSKSQVLKIDSMDEIEDPDLKKLLNEFEANKFLFAYVGTPFSKIQSSDIREGVLPLLESFLPNLHSQEDIDIDIILSNLKEYLASESLYRGGFLFIDNHQTNREIEPGEIQFLETLIRTASYMYQNLALMDKLRYLFVKAEQEAITDPLTGLYNYRYFLHQLNRELSRSQRHHSVFSLILIDIDYFKNYNDTYGHQAGDLILQRISRSMLDNTRVSDMVCRYGGEEFCIICPELNKADARKTAEKLRQIIERLELPKLKDVPDGKLTISSGIASFPEDGESAYQLILRADKALYRAKETGRNKVCAIVEES